MLHYIACHFLDEQGSQGGDPAAHMMFQTEIIGTFTFPDHIVHRLDFSIDIICFGSAESFRQKHDIPPLPGNSVAADAVDQEACNDQENPADCQRSEHPS